MVAVVAAIASQEALAIPGFTEFCRWPGWITRMDKGFGRFKCTKPDVAQYNINYTMGELKCCERIEIGISYDSDIDLAKKIMQEACENHPLILDNRTIGEKKQGLPMVRTAVTRLNDFSVTVRAWAKDYGDAVSLRFDIFESVKKRFDQEGIEIPFPYRTVVLKNPPEASTL